MEKEKILKLMTEYEQFSHVCIKKLSKLTTNQELLTIISHVATSILAFCLFMVYKAGGDLDEYLKMLQSAMNEKTIILIEEDPTADTENLSHTKH
jgi:hypothetical protein